jgi:MFS family permease
MSAVTSGFLIAGLILSVWLAGRLAERRGRSFRTWAWVAAIIGPLALPLLFLFPRLHDDNGGA